jgi:hypothetical protein
MDAVDLLGEKPEQKIAPVSKDERATATKAAALFGTNRRPGKRLKPAIR